MVNISYDLNAVRSGGDIVLKKLLCAATSHYINRHHVWHDGIDYRTRCRRCGTDMLRAESGWRVFDHEQDINPERLPHPRQRESQGQLA